METETRVQDQILLSASRNEAGPHVPGYKRVWIEDFQGASGSAPNANNWALLYTWPDKFPANNEKEAYTNWPEIVHLTGEGELSIVPKRVTPIKVHGAEWASARLECRHSWGCERGEKMIFQAEIKLGDNPQQMGIWPAFWALGKSFRAEPPNVKQPWPKCGEWDILEVVNGRSINHATPHFTKDQAPEFHDAAADGQIFSRTIDFDRSQWHTFSFVVNRTPDPWEEETLTWMIDGNKYSQMTGAFIGNKESWISLARRPFFPILNVAVGGKFPDGVPGPAGGNAPGTDNTPNAATQDGPGSGMKVRYVAVFKSGQNDGK